MGGEGRERREGRDSGQLISETNWDRTSCPHQRSALISEVVFYKSLCS